MAETVEGGVYLSTDGVTYHDANGKPVPASKVKQPAPPLAVRQPAPVEPKK